MDHPRRHARHTRMDGRYGEQGRPVVPAILTAVLVIVALLSATVLSGHFSSTDTYHETFEKLDQKRDTVLTLAAASAGASAALTIIPDDTCTPIAERLSEISKDFAYVVAALLLEKYLLTTLGFVFFSLIIPLCCVLCAFMLFKRRDDPRRIVIQNTVLKLFTFGLVLFLATPASVFITSRIDETYEDSINATLESAKQVTNALEETANQTQSEPTGDPLAFLQKKLGELQAAATSAVESLGDAAGWVKQLLSSFIEAFAVMLVTSIVIPIIVPIVIYLVFKLLFGQQQFVFLPTPDDHALPRADVER